MEQYAESVWFDFDGTLFDTEPDIRNAYLAVFDHFDIEVDPGIFKIGPPMRECILQVFPDCDEATLAAIMARFVEVYDNSGFPGTILYPGVAGRLRELAGAGVKLFIATNKRLNPTLLILDKFELRSCFTAVYGVDSFLPERPAKGEALRRGLLRHRLDAAAAVMVGDTAGDIAAGKFAGMKTLGVTWGYGGGEELRDADTLIDHPDQLRIGRC
jgi:phosphoglycolate phosphatase